MEIGVINGPNLNLLGERETGIYGDLSLEDIVEGLRTDYPVVNIKDYQSNIEGEIIEMLHQWDLVSEGIVLNAGGYTHTSVAIRDAIAAITTPVIEVHMTNILAREEFRHTSLVAPVCIGTITGFGARSYGLAIEQFIFLNT